MKASCAMKSAMVKPTPATTPSTSRWRAPMPAGSFPRPSRSVSQLARRIPSGFPATRPTVTAPTTSSEEPSSAPAETTTPAFASAKIGMMPNATQGWSVSMRLSAGDSASRRTRFTRRRVAASSCDDTSLGAPCASCSSSPRTPARNPSVPSQARTGVTTPTMTPAIVGWTPAT